MPKVFLQCHKYARDKNNCIITLWLIFCQLNFHLWQVWQSVHSGLCVHLCDTDVTAFKIPQDHHKITDNTIITLRHHKGSQCFFFPPDIQEQQLSVFHTPSDPSFLVFYSSTAPGSLFHSSR